MSEKPKLYPGPYSIEFDLLTTISTVSFAHSIELNCKALGDPVAGAAPDTIQIQRKGGGSQSFANCVSNFWAHYRTGHSTATMGIGATLWKYTPGSNEKFFVSAYTIPLGAGSLAGTPTPGHQTQITLRSAAGSWLRVNWLEDPQTLQTQVALVPASTGAATVRVAYYLLSTDGWACARDGSYPVAPMKISYTQNEVLDKKRYRPNN